MARQRRARGSIRPHKGQKNKWLVRVSLGTDADGKRKYESKVVTGPKSAAEEKLTEILRQVDTNDFVESSDLTVKEYVEAWLKTKRPEVNKTTILDYEARMKNDIYPYIGDMPLQDLTPNRVRALWAELLLPEDEGGERGLSSRTVQYTHMIFRQAMTQAHLDKIVKSNPTDGVTRPKRREEKKVQKIQPLTKEEMNTFLRAAKQAKDRHYALWLVLLTTGLRPSEAFALEWKHVDLDAGIIRVRQGLSRIGHGEYKIGGLKTPSSSRDVSIGGTVIEALQAHKAVMAKKQMVGGWRSDLVFPNMGGNTLDISRIRRRWKKALKRAKLEERRLYDARHTHATHLLNAGVNPKVAASRLGHKSTQMFLDVYTHQTEDTEEAADAVEALLAVNE